MVWCIALALFYAAAGIIHIVSPEPFLAITPGWVPWPGQVVLWTGVAELAGAAGLVQPFAPRLRQAAAIGLALYAVCVFPANINHMLIDIASGKPDMHLTYHLPRMVLQPLLVWLALWVGAVTDWPFTPARTAD